MRADRPESRRLFAPASALVLVGGAMVYAECRGARGGCAVIGACNGLFVIDGLRCVSGFV